MDYILNRRSVRKYDLSKKISDEELKDLCRYAESAPSARRQSSREYIIVNNQAIINELSKISKGSMILSECNTVIAIVGKDPNTLITPHMQAQDLSAAVQNILLAATQKGYGSCWIGIYPLEERMKPAKEIFKINDNRFIFALIALGYPQNSECFYDANKLKDDMIHYNEG
jgi:nitroreductase